MSSAGNASAPQPQARGDRVGGWCGIGFVVTLLASEAALTLPDESASAARVAEFYAAHRTTVIVLQLVGLVAAALLAIFAVRLRAFNNVIGNCMLAVAIAGCLPGLATIVLALVADPASPDAAGTWNQFLPRTDDLLFAVAMVFGASVVRLRLIHRWVAMFGGLLAVLCLLRLIDEAVLGRGTFDSLAPIALIVLVLMLAVLSLRGQLGASAPAAPAAPSR